MEDDGRTPRMFRWALQCQFRQFEKVPHFLIGQASHLTLQATSFFIFEVHVPTNMHAVCVCVHNAPNYNTDYRLFNVPI